MFEVELFVGFPISQEFAAFLSLADERVKAVFLQAPYLQELTYQNVKYLGKSAGRTCETQELDLLEKNVYSILKKIVPDYPLESTSLVIFALTTVPNAE